MTTPNVIGYVTEFQEDRPVVHDEKSDTLVPGEITLRFKLKLKNTLGKEMIVWASPENPWDSPSKKAISDFFSSEMTGATVITSNRSIEDLARQIEADLKGEKDAHDKAIDLLMKRTV